MSQMTPKLATELLARFLAYKNAGLTWRQIALAEKMRSPQEAKKAAKEAARVSQRTLLSRSLELAES